MSAAPESAIRAIEEAFLRQMRAEHPDLHWELVDEPSAAELAAPDDTDTVDDRGPLAA